MLGASVVQITARIFKIRTFFIAKWNNREQMKQAVKDWVNNMSNLENYLRHYLQRSSKGCLLSASVCVAKKVLSGFSQSFLLVVTAYSVMVGDGRLNLRVLNIVLNKCLFCYPEVKAWLSVSAPPCTTRMRTQAL